MANNPQLDPDALSIIRRLRGRYSRWDLIQVLHLDIGLRTSELADLAGVSSEVILKWDERDNRPSAERLDDLGDLVTLLLETGRFRPDKAADWLRCPNPAFSFQRPLDVLRQDGYLSVVIAAGTVLRPVSSSRC